MPSRPLRSRSVSCAAAISAFASMFCGPVSLGAQTLRGALPPQPRPQTLAQFGDDTPADNFGSYKGPKLGERFAMGNGKPEPGGKFVIDVLPQKHNGDAGGTGTYQLAIAASGTWQLVNEDRTLAARGVLKAADCRPTLSLSDGPRVFATIEVGRESLSRPMSYEFDGMGTSIAPAVFRVTQDGRPYQSTPVGFNNVGSSIHPLRFALPGPNGERVEIRFGKGEVYVRHRAAKGNAKVFDERMVASLAWMAHQLPGLLGLTAMNDVERASRNCS